LIGRPTKYIPEYCEKLLEFFNIDAYFTKVKTIRGKDGESQVEIDEAAEIPMMQDFCKSIGVDRKTLLNWCDKHPEFFLAYKKAQELQEMIIVKNAIKGRYDKTFSIFMLKCNHKWSETGNTHNETIKIETYEDESGL